MEYPWTAVELPLISGPNFEVKIGSAALLCISLHTPINHEEETETHAGDSGKFRV